jgi:SOS-response transcriptional repressor LexA
MAPAASVTSLRRGELLILELAYPGIPAMNAGVILHDPAAGEIYLRLRRDWAELLPSDEDVDVFEALAEDLEQKASRLGAAGFLEWLESTLSNVLRVSPRRPVAFETPDRALNRYYREFVSSTVRPYKTHVPLYSMRAAAGRFSGLQEVREEGWLELAEGVRQKLTEDLFVAHIEGRSMEPRIPDGSLCLFRLGVTGSRQNRLVLVENLAESASGGQRYTIKRYKSEKAESGEGEWVHKRIVLEPLNPEFEAWELQEGEEVRVIAEFLAVLEEREEREAR